MSVSVQDQQSAGPFRKPDLIVPLTASSPSGLLAEASAVPPGRVARLEWRLDYFAPAVAEALTGAKVVSEKVAKAIADMLAILQGATPSSLLLTWRSAAEGGRCPAANAWYQDLLEKLVEIGAGAVDLEYEACAGPFLLKLLSRARKLGTEVILSRHYFDRTPSLTDLCEVLRKLAEPAPDFAKLACMPRKNLDVANLLVATACLAREQSTPLITMAMGEQGVISRLAGRLFGSQLTFVMVGQASAPGQLPLDQFLSWQRAYQMCCRG